MVNINNIVIVEGRISGEIKYSTYTTNDNNGNQITKEKAFFNVALDRGISKTVKQNNPNVQTADFMPITVRGEAVTKILKPYFSKGKGIRIFGHYTSWQSQNQQTGETQYNHSIESDAIGFCIQDPKDSNGNSNSGNNNSGGYNGSSQNTQSQPPAAPASNPNSNFSMFDDDNQPF